MGAVYVFYLGEASFLLDGEMIAGVSLKVAASEVAGGLEIIFVLNQLLPK